MSFRLLFLLALIFLAVSARAQSPELSPAVQEFVRVRAPKVVLEHVRIIDGTGAPAVEDQNVTIENGQIAAERASNAGLRLRSKSGRAFTHDTECLFQGNSNAPQRPFVKQSSNQGDPMRDAPRGCKFRYWPRRIRRPIRPRLLDFDKSGS